ncbi:Crp/Fnr family transcriptional regulator [Mucilaginibacter sp. L3T2-6]|uniref:Crp/Fnr family transcriptional regulator n=1 Tax=Mucilaginibacter sp. L3T2-6 TaxID=3062491 RepID=UPI002676A42B|nr:Crp/Fnr family transcriptional regulator [Mucilaginibacter sp. L3T2-6]MDO3641113.1 Crp/Fnr family transcriptional regulator [Mucilaginibacter sp. L3T2-6]MDV6213411.1 Crp/Fnr family transcriptional regulator [Mucilaginibacter sp. L3T2-6]
MRVLFNIDRLINPTLNEKAALEQLLQARVLKKNDFFLREGEVCKSLAFIEKGSVRYYYQLEDRECCKDFVFENGLIGSLASFFSRGASPLNIKAMEEATILELCYNDVMHLLSEYPSWRQLAQIIAQEQFVKAEKREAALLKDPPEVRFRSLIEEHPKIFKRVPLTYIASYLGITRETLSRYRSKIRS